MDMTRSKRRWPALLLVGAAALVVGCSDRPSASVETAAAVLPADAAGDGALEAAPLFTLNDLDGNPYGLADSHGKVRLVDFWATWCAPCREEIPMFNELHEAYGEKGLEILAISDFDEGPELVREFVEEYGVKYKNLIGTEQVATDYPVVGLPTAFLIDREGRVVQRYFGPKPKKVLEKEIRRLLELPPAI